MERIKLYQIVAVDEDWGIGKDNAIPWHSSRDLKLFKQLTSGHTVIMGRKTYESIPGYLRNRSNIILTTDPDNFKKTSEKFLADDTKPVVLSSIYDLIPYLSLNKLYTAFIIGGEQLYKSTQNECDRLYITKVKGRHDCDTFYPKPDRSKWVKHTQPDLGDPIIRNYDIYQIVK